MGIGQDCAQNRLSTKQCALAQRLPKVFECGGALPKKRCPEAQQWNGTMSRRMKTTPHNTRNPRQQNFAYQNLRIQRWRPGELSPRHCTSLRMFHFRREAPISSAEKGSGLSLFFLAGASHNEARHCEQCRKHTRSHMSCSWRKGKRSVPTCVSVHKAQVPARHRPR